MCGICGALGFDSSAGLVRRMNQAMVHRGPDSDGFLDDGPIALGMRRLRIIDLHTGDQPLFSEDRQVALILNGEIYNFRDLRSELEALGHRFTSHSDAEVVVHAYEQWGRDRLPRLRGMFALALCDRRGRAAGQAGRLLLARDRLGIKPLYLWHDGRRLAFASEVRALLASGLVPRTLSTAGLYTFLAFGSVQEPLTLVEGVTSLDPGSWLQAELEGGALTIESGTYWRPPRDGQRDPEPAQVRHWLADAVGSHLVSDVPLGAFLSGGLDSGAIVALGSEALNAPLRTFTLAFDAWPGDEREIAAQTARVWQSDHHVRVLAPGEVLAELPQAVAAMDQPTVDGINTWYVSREARRAGLTVALSGLGGDELFAGYASFHQVPRLRRVQRTLRWLPKGSYLEDLIARLPGSSPGQRKLGALISGGMFLDHAYFAARSLFTPGQVRSLLSPRAVEILQEPDGALGEWRRSVQAQLRLSQGYDAVGEVSWLELSQYMRSTLLRDADAMSMAHSLEVRVPFVDHRLVEQVLPVEGRHKMKGRVPKPLLVEALEGRLPPAVTTGAKRTFTFPFERWLRQEWATVVGGGLVKLPDGLAANLDGTAVRQVWSQFGRGHTNWPRPWALYVLAEWVRRNL
jgi:asparagine synthase (glutamine-hydrolysing)